jgi:hypothetical protein
LGQVVQHVCGHEIFTVGVAHGQSQPRHPHQSIGRDLGETAFGGDDEGNNFQRVLATEDAVADSGLVFVSDVPSRPYQAELLVSRSWEHTRVVGGLDVGRAKALQPRWWPAAVRCPASHRPVEWLGVGQADAGQNQAQLATTAWSLVNDPARIVGPDGQQTQAA